MHSSQFANIKTRSDSLRSDRRAMEVLPSVRDHQTYNVSECGNCQCLVVMRELGELLSSSQLHLHEPSWTHIRYDMQLTPIFKILVQRIRIL